MSKKSRRPAATYAMKSKVKKTPGRPNIPTQYPVDAGIAGTGYIDHTSLGQESVDYSGYKYVVSDLRRMGILIGGLAIVLIILTIFLR